MNVYLDHHKKPHTKPKEVPVVWRPGAYGILTNEKGEWFLVEPMWAKEWDLPGGGIELEESVREGLVREFYEETGHKVHVLGEPLHLGESRFFHEKLGFCHSIFFIYKVELDGAQRDEQVVNTFEDGLEIRRGEWVNPRSLKEEDIHPIYWPFVRGWQEQNRKSGYHNL